MYTCGLLKMRRVGIYALYSIDWDNLDSYAADILKDVRRGIGDDPSARIDVMKLWAAQRLIPEGAKST